MKFKKDYKEFVKQHRSELDIMFREVLIAYRDEALDMECKTEEDFFMREKKIEFYKFIRDTLFKMKMIVSMKEPTEDKFI